MIKVWRVVHRQYSETAFLGIGAKKFGGRFNLSGYPVVYCSSSLSLSLLEVLVQINKPYRLKDYIVRYAEIDETFATQINADEFPKGWNRIPYSTDSQHFGMEYFTRKNTPVLKVPSVVVPVEWNYILNITHASLQDISVSKEIHDAIDLRLISP